GSGFLSTSSVQWESASHKFSEAGVRLVILRIGIVLSLQGGALPALKKTLPLGIAPVLGSGKQYYAWIHIDDVCGFIMHVLSPQPVSGTFNLCAGVSTQKELMQAIQKIYGRFSVLMPAPAFVLRLMLGEMADTVLISQRVNNNKLLQSGYQLKYSNITAALEHLRSTSV
ncbi:MAG: DUF1731 domain-containing protein, partial [Chitinophagales bacterium]